MADSSNPLEAEFEALIPQIAAQFDLPRTFGAYLICTFFGCIMLGLTIHQTYRYFRFYPNDLMSLKALVCLVLGLDILHSISSMHICYFYLVSNFFRPARLLEGVWSIRLIILEMGLLIVVAHCFYARRLYLLANHNIIPAMIIAVLLAAELALCITVTVDSYKSVTFKSFEHYSWVMWSILSVAVAADIVATTALTYYLRRSRTGFTKTDSIVDILMVYTINTGLSTSIMTFAALLCSILMRKNLVYSAILVVSTKMYANSLLAVLNSRRGILDKGMSAYETGSFGMKLVEGQDMRADRHELRAISFRASRPPHLKAQVCMSALSYKSFSPFRDVHHRPFPSFHHCPRSRTRPSVAVRCEVSDVRC
ncbi:hypothetical protein PYCCODRAFT_1439206 [Trametes coccinea BRFM310]|uniref:DUF6534 domain-containing protein n=1 Tax=Trametes coccinea (strain BRFM310) TaxID=1353009 RepID=A0A1Y2IBK9_TRAC3|nr:hypothetical protein PYCCODRAFT_1439206 [Trametes coccinea BRFM310]